MWQEFLHISFSLPVIVFTIPFVVSMFFWMMSLLGIVDIDFLDFDVDVDVDGSTSGQEMLGLLSKLGLDKVPVTIVFTILSIAGYVAAYVSTVFLLPLVGGTWLVWPAGLVIIVGGLFVAVMVARMIIGILSPLLKKVPQASVKSIQGQTAVVITSRVDANFGEARVDDGAGGLQLKVRTDVEGGFKKGDRVVLLEYLDGEHVWRVIAESNFV